MLGQGRRLVAAGESQIEENSVYLLKLYRLPALGTAAHTWFASVSMMCMQFEQARRDAIHRAGS